MKTLLHIGVGNFHRAHQAAYVQAVNDLGDAPWEILGVSLRSPSVRDALAPQQFDYTLVVRDGDGSRYQRITCLRDVIFAGEDPERVIDAIAKADLITMTITEKGYGLGPDGKLDLENAEISTDLAGGAASAIGLLTRGLAKRSTPVAVLSCDNLNSNGRTLEAAVQAFGTAAGLQISQGAVFPSTMVDRITPATTDGLRTEVKTKTGFQDRAPVETEAFSDWVIERFDAPCPDWSKVRVEFVDDVEPYELRKLRLLNGAHSALAYAGILAGHEFVHEAVADRSLAALATGVMEEAAQTLPTEIETTNYARALMDRFANPALHHKLRQIAMDGSQKLPVRLIGTICDRQALGLASPNLWAGLEAWATFVMAEVEAGRALQDPADQELAKDARAKEAMARLLSRVGAPERED